MSLMKVNLRLLLLMVYVTDEGLRNIITVRVVCHWWMSSKDYYCSWCMSLITVYLRLLLFMLNVTDEGLLKIITVRGVCDWRRST
jgi:hypothetical protein